MITNELREAVRKEAIFLRSFATQEQLDKLDFMNISPWEPSTCIYGQMTGSCYSDEALDLFKKCAQPFAGALYGMEDTGLKPPMVQCYDDIESCEPAKGLMDKAKSLSAIEYYISLPDAEFALQGLTDFLQKKTDKLEL